jgi:hypothetical protein
VSSQADIRAGVSDSFPLPWVVGLWATFLIGAALLSAGLATLMTIAYTFGAFTLFALPGFFVTPIFFPSDPATRLERSIYSVIVGIALSSYAAILTGFRVGWNPKSIALALVALGLGCAVCGALLRGRLALSIRSWSRSDYAMLAGIGIVVVLFSAIPALRVGKLTSQGYAYTWLYGFDFLYRADVIQAMTNHMPPDWHWMSGVPLRMYLVGYAIPAFAYAASGKTLILHSVLLLTTLACGYLMLASLYVFLRTVFSETKVLLSALFLTLISYSYYWVYDIARTFFFPPGRGLFGSISTVSHHIQRTLLVEPQAALATSLLLIVLAMLAMVRFRLNSVVLALAIGVFLAISFGMEAMQGLLAVAWFGLFYFLRIVLKKSPRDEFLPFLAAVASCGVVALSFFALGMYARSTSHLAPITFNPWIAEFGLPYFLIEMGPLLILGAWGTFRWWRGSREEFGWPLLLLALITVLQVLLVFQKPPARMADRLLPFALIPFSAYLLREFWSNRLGRIAAVAISAVVLLGVPTFFTDIHSTSGVDNPYDTRYVHPADMQACQWIRQNLPETAVVQGNYDYFSGIDRGLYMSLIASFAQRPQILGWTTNAAYVVDNGWPIAKERRADLDQMFTSTEISSVVRVVRKYAIDYLYFGPHEAVKYPQFRTLLQSAPDQFHEVYSRDGVSIFQFLAAVPGTTATHSVVTAN